MSAEPSNYLEIVSESRHSALDELARDERRPALFLVTGLVIAVVFFAFGIIVGRWTTQGRAADVSPTTRSSAAGVASASTLLRQSTTNQTRSPNQTKSAESQERRFAILVASYEAPEDAQPMIKSLKSAGYKNIRIDPPKPEEPKAKFSLLVGSYTQEEAKSALTVLSKSGDVRLKNVRIIEAAFE